METGAEQVFFIEPVALELAIALVEFLKKALIHLLGQEVTTSRVAAALKKVLAIVRAHNGRISRRNLQRKSNLLVDDFSKVMRTLESDGRLKVTVETTESGQNTFTVTLGADDGDEE